MTKHTPGPWKVISGTVYIGKAHDAAPDDRDCIAHMEWGPNVHARPVERDANVRLIAAAVELLEALKELEALRKMPHPSGDLDAAVAYRQRERDAVALAKAAIAKAERQS